VPEEKINKYGFIHVGKDLLEKAGLPAKTDVPLKISYDKARNAFVCVIDTTAPAEVSAEAPGDVIAEETTEPENPVEMPQPDDEIAAEKAALKSIKDTKRGSKKPKK